MHIERTVHIKRPASEVFDFLVDLANHPRVAASITSVRGSTRQPGPRAGQRLTGRAVTPASLFKHPPPSADG